MTKEQKLQHSKSLQSFYWKKLRSKLITEHNGKWIVMRTKSEYQILNTSELDHLFGDKWS